MIRLIIFDFDGTLGDTRANIVMTMRDTMRALGLEEPLEEAIAATIGIPLADGFAQLYPGMSPEETQRCAVTYRQIFEKNRKLLVPGLFPHVKETLALLRAQGCTLSVASSRMSSSLHGFLHDMGIEEYISYVLGVDNVEKAKPDPEPVLKTLRDLGMRPEETLVVGDMPVDILMGARAGARTCAVTYGNASRTDLATAGADYIIDEISQLPNLLRRKIRAAAPGDVPEIMTVLKAAKGIMRASGNMNQWVNGYPSQEVIIEDIALGHGFVVEDQNKIVAYFAFIPSPEPTYAKIYDGAWLEDTLPYHVVHRIGSLPDAHGIFDSVMDWCFAHDPNIRIDTHRNNSIMRHCIEKYGFRYCGIIYLLDGNERLAYQKLVK